MLSSPKPVRTSLACVLATQANAGRVVKVAARRVVLVG
jgi:hypothetical protein